jgi:hypothetical protein
MVWFWVVFHYLLSWFFFLVHIEPSSFVSCLSFKCVKESSLPILQVSSQISSCERKFFKCLRVSCKGFVLWHIAIEWERFQVRSSNISKFFNFKFSHLHFIWIQKLRVFVLAFVFNKMSSFQMESLKVMEKFDGGNFHLWKFKMRMMLFKHGL